MIARSIGLCVACIVLGAWTAMASAQVAEPPAGGGAGRKPAASPAADSGANEPAPRRAADEPASDPFAGLEETPTRPANEAALDLPAAGSARARQQIGDEPAPFPVRDEQIRTTQTPGRPGGGYSDANSPLPPAREPLSGSAGALPVAETAPGSPFLLPSDRLPLGPSTMGLTVEVGAPEFANLNIESSFWIKINNVGPTDALGVIARYEVPAGVEYIESEPAASSSAPGLVTWQISTLPSRTEKVIKVKVRPSAKGAVDHAVTVALMAGSRSRSMVRQPQLQVDIRANKPKPLEGEPVVFDIDVNNVGDHPARDVVVQANLSSGLRHPEGSSLKLSLKRELGVSAIAPGEKVSLKLEVDTIAMGAQTCDIVLSSQDVIETVSKRATVDVVSPNVELTISGPTERFPDSRVRYVLTVTNSGSASARRVRVAAVIPPEGKAMSADPAPQLTPEKRRMDWEIAELHPQDSRTFTIEVKMGNVGLFTLNAGATHEGLRQNLKAAHSTEIRGIPKLVLAVSEDRGALDEGEETEFEIRIRNAGSKEATGLLVTGKVTENLQLLSLESADSQAGNPPPADATSAVFPRVDRLPPGAEVTMRIRAKAMRAGDATCQVRVEHDDYQGTGGLSQTVVTKVTPGNSALR